MVPHMMPAGAIWMFLRHTTDKHNIMYVHSHRQDSTSSQLPRTASTFVIIAAGLSALGLFSFLILVKQAAFPAILALLLSIPVIVMYAWLNFVEWPRLDEARIEKLFENETPLQDTVCDIYLHPVGRLHRQLLRAFEASEETSEQDDSLRIAQ